MAKKNESKADLLERRLEHYKEHNEVLDAAINDLNTFIDRSIKMKQTDYHEIKERAETSVRIFDMQFAKASNDGFIEKITVDVERQRIKEQKNQEWMDKNYADLIERSRKYLAQAIDEQRKTIIKSTIERYDKGEKEFNDAMMLQQVLESLGEFRAVRPAGGESKILKP